MHAPQTTAPLEPYGTRVHGDRPDASPAPEQPLPDHELPAREGPPRPESLAILAIAGLAFFLLGYRVVLDQHVVVFESLDRLSRALMVWHDDPAKLASVGFAFPPIPTLLMLPLAAIKPLATSGVALPLFSSAFAAGAIVVLNRTLALLDMPRALRWPLLGVLALNPMFAFHASNGSGHAVHLFFLALGLGSFLAWATSRQPRHLIGAGIGFSIAMLARYEYMLWALLVALLIGIALTRRGVERDELEGSLVAYLTPVVYGLTLWVFFNWLIVGEPFGWIDPSVTASVNNPGMTGDGASLGDALGRVLESNAGLFPLTLLALPVLLLLAFWRNYVAVGLGLMIAISFGTVAVSAAIEGNEAVVELSDALPAMLATIAGVGWLYRTFVSMRPLVYAVALLAALASLPLAWSTMQDYPFQNQEHAFIRALASGEDQEGRSSRGGFTVGIASERAMARFIDRNVRGRDSILTDNSQTFGVMLLTGEPALFLDRVTRGDDFFARMLERPADSVRYLLVSSAASDLVRQRYPEAAEGAVAGLRPVFRTPRYALLRVTGPISAPAS